MKTRKITLGIALVAIAGSILFGSCRKKEKVEEKDTDTASASDQSLASSISNDMVNISDEASSTTTSTLSSYKVADAEGLLSNSCATVSSVVSGSTKTVTVDFGTSNCLCKDNRYRRGVLTITFTGNYLDSNTVVTVTPQNYFVNDNQVNGSKTITNKGHNSANHLVYEINANIQVTKANGGGNVSWQSIRQREWTAGESTPLNWSDDMYSITGNAYGTTSNGNTFYSIITVPLVRNMSLGCRRHFVSGLIEHTPGGKPTRYLDYGNGACDDQATVTINGVTYNITLP
jgi:hypothetical protein